jgi:hypothetical protein
LDVYHAWKHALRVRLEKLHKDTKDYDKNPWTQSLFEPSLIWVFDKLRERIKRLAPGGKSYGTSLIVRELERERRTYASTWPTHD